MNIKIPGLSDKLQDNRNKYLKGDLTKADDWDAAFREICAEYDLSLQRTKAFCKCHNDITLAGLLRLAKRVNGVLVIDGFHEFFFIKYSPAGENAVDFGELTKKGSKNTNEVVTVQEKVTYNPDEEETTAEEPIEEEQSSDRFAQVEGSGEPEAEEEVDDLF